MLLSEARLSGCYQFVYTDEVDVDELIKDISEDPHENVQAVNLNLDG